MEQPSEVSIGTAVRKLRELKEMSQADLAKVSGVSQQYISKLESDEVDPAFSKINAIAEALGVRISELMGVMDKSVSIRIDNNTQGMGIVNGPFTLNLQMNLANEEREMYKLTISALQMANAALQSENETLRKNANL